MTRQELSERIGVTRQTVFRWEQGVRIPDLPTFLRLDDALEEKLLTKLTE